MPSSMHPAIGRRGAILLIALTALTLFMMIGTLMLVTATRTRDAARAFANLASSTSATTAHADAVLDEALLFVLRGRRDQTRLTPLFQNQSLLEDKYGPTSLSGTAVAGTVKNLTEAGPLQGRPVILEANVFVGGTTTLHSCDFNGRVLTLKPAAGDGDIASYRILRAIKKPGNSAPFTLYFANLASNRTPRLPKQDCEIVINGREFTQMNAGDKNEPYDSFDDTGADPVADPLPPDPWLAQVELDGSTVARVPRPSFGSSGTTPACDNDNDGVLDGVWISGLVPDRPAPGGGLLTHDLSFLIVDLDGRLNVNAHGSPTLVAPNPANWPASFVTTQIASVPVGLGYGPADIDVSRLFASGTQPAGVPGWQGRFANLCQSGSTVVSSTTQRRPTPQIGTPVVGRYGPVDTTSGSSRWVPGKPNSIVDPLTQCSLGGTVTGTGAASNSSRLVGASPTDLNSRMKVFVQNAATGSPTLTFYLSSGTASNDMLENPYQFRLDADAPRPQQVRFTGTAAPADNVFTTAELERILRQFDPDAANLPPRLATLLDDFAERSRMTITTDSWDTPVISGSAMLRISGTIRSFPDPTVITPSAGSPNAATVYDVVSPDVSAGLRFDLNRPLEHPAVAATLTQDIKERYCRHLYTLLVALGQPANADTAQWVANVVDFRDADSTMTRFRYDTNPWDGWTASDGIYVFGAERPELVFTESVAWTGKLAVVLYHPWDARLVDKDSPSDAANKYVATERVDPNLALASDPKVLDLTRKQGNDSVWRLRVSGGATVAFANQNGGAANKCRLKPNEYLGIQTDSSMGGSVSSIQDSTLLPVASDGGRSGVVYLERLADPSKPLQNSTNSKDFNPYVIVDEVPIVPATDQTTAMKMTREPSAFWTRRNWVPGVPGVTAPAAYPSAVPWFHWPNRPFIGAAELALVPTGSASGILASGTAPSPARSGTSLILEAVHVPSRFAGTTLRIGDDSLLQTAATSESICTTMLPRWREPGRVNVNTVVSNTNNPSALTPNPLDNGVWQALLGDGAPKNSFVQSGTSSAKSVGDMLTLRSGTAVFAESTTPPRNADDFFSYARAIRLSNVGTIRSHVFAVWITLRIRDTSAAPADPVYRRAFAIIDRSIPVGFSRGEDLNVRDTIRLIRFLD